MTVKRRVVWFSDDDWAAFQRRAADADMSVSAWLRHRVERAEDWAASEGVDEPTVGPIVHEFNRAERFNTRPFTPVPKARK